MPTIGARVAQRLGLLASDYETVAGSRFANFVCPILYSDEDVELCEGHIVNQAFRISTLWTVQRKDVDGFFGSVFESDFADLRYHGRRASDVLADRPAAKRLKPRILASDGREIPYYYATGNVPSIHSRLIVGEPGAETTIALKAPPDDLEPLTSAPWKIVMGKDLRIPSLVSALKAAHLTLFHLLGYRYVFSTGGHFLGHEVLGKFVRANLHHRRRTALANANAHFREFAHMLRVSLNVPDTFRGTAEEGAVFICERGSIRWGMVVLIRTTPGPIHFVLVPLMEQPVAVDIFLRFLRGQDERVTLRLAWFRGDRWEAAKDTIDAEWPKTGVLYPASQSAASI